MKAIFVVLITIVWIGLYKDGLLAKFDVAQWGLLGILTFLSLYATGLTWYIDYTKVKKECPKFRCCNCGGMFEGTEIFLEDDGAICEKCNIKLSQIY